MAYGSKHCHKELVMKKRTIPITTKHHESKATYQEHGHWWWKNPKSGHVYGPYQNREDARTQSRNIRQGEQAQADAPRASASSVESQRRKFG